MNWLYGLSESPGTLFLLGAAGTILLGPTVGTLARPVLKSAASGVFRATNRIGNVAGSVAQEWQSIVQEAQQDVRAQSDPQVAALGHS